MREKRWRLAAANRVSLTLSVAIGLLMMASIALCAPVAWANVGYELNASTPSRSLGSGSVLPHGIAVDQASRRIHVAVVLTSTTPTPGEILRFESNLTSAGTLTGGNDPYYSGVAVNPVTQGLYAARATLSTPMGKFGSPGMDLFSSTGTLGTPFAVTETGALPQIAADSGGDVYYPNAATHSVQVFNASGVLQEEITCAGCPGGTFGKPVSVAVGPANELYVADLDPDRVVKLTSSGGPYSYSSVLQSGKDAAAVGVNPANGDVFVGNLPDGRRYHITAYTSAGVQYDDFGAGLFTDPDAWIGALVAMQIAVDATSNRLYVGDVSKFYIFDRVTITPPTATANAASKVGQLTATLNATVNAKGHALLDCDLEYVDHADFLSSGFADATDLPCPKAVDGLSDTALEAKISGLGASTTYHYRVSGTSHAGSTTSNVQTFTTLPVLPPTVTTDPPIAVTRTSASLRGKVNPRGGVVSDCHFELGTSTAYGTNLPCASLPEPVSTEVAQSRSALGLTAETTYHYRLVVTSNAGTVKGANVQFTTPSAPSIPPTTPPSDSPPTTAPPTTSPPPLNVVPPVTAPKPKPLRCRKGFRKKRVRGKLRCVKKRAQRSKRRAAR